MVMNFELYEKADSQSLPAKSWCGFFTTGRRLVKKKYFFMSLFMFIFFGCSAALALNQAPRDGKYVCIIKLPGRPKIDPWCLEEIITIKGDKIWFQKKSFSNENEKKDSLHPIDPFSTSGTLAVKDEKIYFNLKSGGDSYTKLQSSKMEIIEYEVAFTKEGLVFDGCVYLRQQVSSEPDKGLEDPTLGTESIQNNPGDLNISINFVPISTGKIIVHGPNFDGIITTPDEGKMKNAFQVIWTPSSKDIEKTERALQKFFSPIGDREIREAPLSDYVRVYLGTEVKGSKVIEVFLNLWRKHKSWRDQDCGKRHSADGRSEGTVVFVVKVDPNTGQCFDYNELDIGY